jgi:4-oxalocrotonate tautomerase
MSGHPFESTMSLDHFSSQEASMPFIHVRVVAGVFTAQQKREIVERLTEAMVAIQGEGMRQLTWCVVEEVPSGSWGIGGQAITADDVRAIARGAAVEA